LAQLSSRHFNLLLYAFLKPDAPPVIPSQACGVIQFYQFNARRGGYFERVSIRFDGAQYNRHLFFDKHLKKIPQGQKACFEYLDKFKYPHLAESKLVKWIEPS